MLINIVSELLGEQTRFQMLSKLNCQCVPGRWIRKSDSVSTKGATADPTIFQAWADCIYMAGRQWLSGVVRNGTPFSWFRFVWLFSNSNFLCMYGRRKGLSSKTERRSVHLLILRTEQHCRLINVFNSHVTYTKRCYWYPRGNLKCFTILRSRFVG